MEMKKNLCKARVRNDKRPCKLEAIIDGYCIAHFHYHQKKVKETKPKFRIKKKPIRPGHARGIV